MDGKQSEVAKAEFTTERSAESRFIGVRVTGPAPDTGDVGDIVKAAATAMRFPYEQAITEEGWVYEVGSGSNASTKDYEIVVRLSACKTGNTRVDPVKTYNERNSDVCEECVRDFKELLPSDYSVIGFKDYTYSV